MAVSSSSGSNVNPWLSTTLPFCMRIWPVRLGPELSQFHPVAFRTQNRCKLIRSSFVIGDRECCMLPPANQES
jgi:hypothetical protein